MVGIAGGKKVLEKTESRKRKEAYSSWKWT
jgi:hypothetical protein